MPFHLFPSNGLDRSLHAPILVGVLFLTFFAETFGWTYAGLVVPGYLAAVFVAAPYTGVLTVVEALLTYGIVTAIGRWAPKTGAWSSAFGRERFFLFIVCGVLVRYFMEAWVCPEIAARYPFEHARELYSVGLVIVPLFANVFWNTGGTRAAPRLFVVTALTYAVLRFGLLPYTNYSLSRFLIANESGALDFLASSKAQIILIVGALVAARSNVLYGWDYNGILVPALLGVSWYEPKKLAATLAEAVLVYAIAAGIAALRPFRHMLLVGTRRLLLAVIVGFCVKLGVGFALQRHAPDVQLNDYLGFGYILPTLLAVKMWNRGRVGVVLMPTVQVSLVAFVVGNGVGFGLSHLRAPVVAVEAAVAPPLAFAAPAFQLALADVAPDAPSPWSRADARARFRLGATVAAELRADPKLAPATLEAARAAHLRVTTHATSAGATWGAVTPLSSDPEVFEPGPRWAVRLAPGGEQPWVVVITAPGPGAPVFDAALRVAEALDARAVAVVSAHADVAALDSEALAGLARAVLADRLLVVEQRAPATSSLSIAGAWDHGLDSVVIERALGISLTVEWRARGEARSLLSDAPRLRLGPADAERVGVALVGDVPVESWPGPLGRELPARLEALTTVGADGATPPAVDELRLFRASVASSFAALGDGQEPSAWARIVAGRLGFRYARVGAEPLDGWALHEPAGPARRGHPTLFVRPGHDALPLVIEVPAPRWELGSAAAGIAFLQALPARGLLIAGSLPNADATGKMDPRRVDGRRGHFQLAHEALLSRGFHTLSLQGTTPERAPPEDAILSTSRELAPDDEEPAWTAPVRASLEALGYSVARLDGARAHAPFGGASEPTTGFAEKFAPGRHAVLWMTPHLRQAFALRGDEARPGSDLLRLPEGLPTLDVAQRALELLTCARAAPGAGAPEGCPAVTGEPCDLEAAAQRWRVLSQEHNPNDLRAALGPAGHACVVEVAHDAPSSTVWATVASAAGARIVPVGGAPVDHTSAPLRDARAVRQGLTLGLAALRVEP